MAASWKDDYTENCKVELNLSSGQTVNSGDVLLEAGKLIISVSDDFKNKSTAEITLTAIAVYGLENLQGNNLQVDQEVNLLQGITFAEGLTLKKVEVEENGVRTEIANPNAYIPQSAGTINIIITLGRIDGSTIEVRVDGLPVKGITYNEFLITDLKPVEILPIIGQVEAGDKNVYSHIEHLRVAEATRIIDMMWEYGAGNHTRDAYRELMGRLYTGMTLETPEGFDNYRIL